MLASAIKYMPFDPSSTNKDKYDPHTPLLQVAILFGIGTGKFNRLDLSVFAFTRVLNNMVAVLALIG
jgi:hypothetical protein